MYSVSFHIKFHLDQCIVSGLQGQETSNLYDFGIFGDCPYQLFTYWSEIWHTTVNLWF